MDCERQLPTFTPFDSDSPLHVAVRGGRVENVRRVLDRQLVDVNCLNFKHETPLHLACFLGYEDIVVLLIAFGADPYIKDSSGSITYGRCTWKTADLMNKMVSNNDLWISGPTITKGDTSLHAAVRQGNLGHVERLIQQETVTVSPINTSYETPLHLACALGHTAIAHLLVYNRADMYKKDCFGNAPIHRAVARGHIEIVNLLIAIFGCQPNIRGYQGRTLLHFASATGNVELVTISIKDYGIIPSSTDAMNQTPLHIAASHGQEKVIDLLITKYNCPVDDKSKYDFTPLHMACYCGHVNTVRSLICDHKANVKACDQQNDTLLHKAAMGGHTDIVNLLINEFHFCPKKGLAGASGDTDDVKNEQSRTPLHTACISGHTNVVKTYVAEFGTELLNERDNENDTPLSKAVFGGHNELVQILIKDFNCSPHAKGFAGRSLLHHACDKGHIMLAVMLITEFNLDPCLTDDNGDTPLHIACLCGHEELARLLIAKFNCLIDVKNKQYMTPYFLACIGGHTNVVTMFVTEFLGKLGANPLKVAIDSRNANAVHALATYCTIVIEGFGQLKPFLHQVVHEGGSVSLLRKLLNFGHDPACVDDDDNTLLHTAVKCDKDEIVQMLAGEFSNCCPIDSRNSQGQTPLHLACVGGNVRVVELLLSHNASIYIRDGDGNTPIKMAHNSAHYRTLQAIFSVFGISSKIINTRLFHHVCDAGTVELLDTLLSDFKLDPSSLNDEKGNSLIHTAVSCGRLDIARHLLERHRLDVECRNTSGQTPLHLICSKAPANSVQNLLDLFIHDYKADITSRDTKGDQPIHAAALVGRSSVVTELILSYNSAASTRGFKNRSILHQVLAGGFVSAGKTFIDVFHLSVHCADDDGNTPLHLSSLNVQLDSVRMLLYDYHAPLFVRNKAGKTALDLTSDNASKIVFREYMDSEHKRIQAEYKKLRFLSMQKFPGERKITKVFVVGHPESGKSTLIESLKNKGFISSMFNLSVSRDVVPLHTAGIVPSFYDGKDGGRCLYYDFAGDKEYYSSHSAILEIVSQSPVGLSVFVVVAKLTKEIEILCNEVGYWLSFISYHAKVVDSARKMKVVIVLSHSDCLSSLKASSKLESLQQYLQAENNNFSVGVLDVIDIITSNCCKPRSSRTIEDTLQQISKHTPPHTLSFESTLLHGLLEKDFKNVVACELNNLVNHVQITGILLPNTAVELYPIVKDLHNTGLLMIIGRNSEPVENHLLLLNPCTLTNEVHQKLFSKAAKKSLSKLGSQYANLGIIPESHLQELLPEHITKECLIQLQYCQEFSHTEVGLDYLLAPDISDDSDSKDNLLYFPALCNLETKSSNWARNTNLTFNIGWYAKCKEAFDYFPARFLHVILLRLAFSFALPIASCNVSESCIAQAYSRRCTMWKNGIHWLMEEGVECTFEVVDDNKGMVVIIKAEESCKSWTTVLGDIVDVAMKAKAEFCDTVSLHHFLLKSSDPMSFKDYDKLFDMNDVQRVVTEGKNKVVSVDGSNFLDSSTLSTLKLHTCWGKLQ